MIEKKVFHAFPGAEEADAGRMKFKNQQNAMETSASMDDAEEYGSLIVNLFGIEFYTEDTPLKITDANL